MLIFIIKYVVMLVLFIAEMDMFLWLFKPIMERDKIGWTAIFLLINGAGFLIWLLSGPIYKFDSKAYAKQLLKLNRRRFPH